MLDFSVPYQDIVMIHAGGPTPPPALPEGYAFRMYEAGDERHWARIETSVREFDQEAQALRYFEKTYLPHAQVLPQRLVFVVDPAGRPVGNSSAWFETIDGQACAKVHWVAVQPDQQGRGLGKAVVLKTLELMGTLDPGKPILLHTQTWSHMAVRIYLRAGFRPIRNGLVGRERSHFPEACAILRRVFEPRTFRLFSEEAVYLH